VQTGGENVFVNEGFQQRKLLFEFEEKHKLAQLCFPQSNLDSSGAQGQELKEVVKAVTRSLSYAYFPNASLNVNVTDPAIFQVICNEKTYLNHFPSQDL